MADNKPYPPYPEGMILLVEVGSTAHGTGLPGGEDHDETAVMVHRSAGLQPPEVPGHGGCGEPEHPAHPLGTGDRDL